VRESRRVCFPKRIFDGKNIRERRRKKGVGFKLFTKKCEKNAEKVLIPPPSFLVSTSQKRKKKRPLSPRRKNNF